MDERFIVAALLIVAALISSYQLGRFTQRAESAARLSVAFSYEIEKVLINNDLTAEDAGRLLDTAGRVTGFIAGLSPVGALKIKIQIGTMAADRANAELARRRAAADSHGDEPEPVMEAGHGDVEKNGHGKL
jgi:uncharacterized alpha-E superfamily protein